MAAGVFLAPPYRSAAEQPIFWHGNALKTPVILSHRIDWPASWTIGLEPEHWPGEVALYERPDELHAIVTTKGDYQFRVWLPEAPRFGSPVAFILPVENIECRCAECVAFQAFLHGKRLPRMPKLENKHRKLILGLRAIDAQRDHASYRTIAAALFGQEAVDREHWKTSSLRQQVIRLIAWTNALIDGGYTKLLCFGGIFATSVIHIVEEYKPFVG